MRLMTFRRIIKLKHCSLCRGFQETVFWSSDGEGRVVLWWARWKGYRSPLTQNDSRKRTQQITFLLLRFRPEYENSFSFRNVGSHKMRGEGHRPKLPSRVSPHTNTRTLHRYSWRSRNVSCLCSYVRKGYYTKERMAPRYSEAFRVSNVSFTLRIISRFCSNYHRFLNTF